MKTGDYLSVVNDSGSVELTEVTCVTQQNSSSGLVNVLTGSETIIVNDIVGSVLTKRILGRESAGINFLQSFRAIHSVVGSRAGRCIYRMVERAIDSKLIATNES